MYTGKGLQNYQVVIVKTNGTNAKCLSVTERINKWEDLNTEKYMAVKLNDQEVYTYHLECGGEKQNVDEKKNC